MSLLLASLALSSCTIPGTDGWGINISITKPLNTCVAVKPKPQAHGLEAWANSSKFWPQKSVLRVKFLSGSTAQKAEAWKRFQQIQSYINLQFVQSTGASEIRVRFDHNAGHWSYVGKDCLGISRTKPTMNLALKTGWFGDGSSEWDRVALHEILHAIGLNHEHQHPLSSIPWNDRAVIQYYMSTQGWTEEEVRFQVLNKEPLTNDYRGTTYDPSSIMEYPIPPELTTNGFSVGWNRKLSPLDIKFIQTIYPK